MLLKYILSSERFPQIASHLVFKIIFFYKCLNSFIDKEILSLHLLTVNIVSLN